MEEHDRDAKQREVFQEKTEGAFLDDDNLLEGLETIGSPEATGQRDDDLKEETAPDAIRSGNPQTNGLISLYHRTRPSPVPNPINAFNLNRRMAFSRASRGWRRVATGNVSRAGVRHLMPSGSAFNVQ
jgi:hypothetical protein